MAEALERVDNFFEESDDDYTYGFYGASTTAVPQLIGNTAPLQEPEVIPEQIPEVQPEPPIRPVPRRKQEPVRRKAAKSGRKSKVVFLLSALIFLVGAFSIVASYSQVYARKARINHLNQELKEARIDTALITGESSEEIRLEELYEYATTDMGMRNASGESIVYIHLNAHSYTKVTEPSEPTGSRVTYHWFS